MQRGQALGNKDGRKSYGSRSTGGAMNLVDSEKSEEIAAPAVIRESVNLNSDRNRENCLLREKAAL